MDREVELCNVNTEPSCELAASSSQNTLPGCSYTELNTDMRIASKKGCIPGCYYNIQSDKGILFSQVS